MTGTLTALGQKGLTELLRLYKESPCLWDPSHENYSNQHERKKAYAALIEKLAIEDEDISINALKKKLDNMRSTYRRERKKVLSAYAKGEYYRPTLWYYDLLTFVNGADDSSLDMDKIDTTIDHDYSDSVELDHAYEDYEEVEQKYKKPKMLEVYLKETDTYKADSKYTYEDYEEAEQKSKKPKMSDIYLKENNSYKIDSKTVTNMINPSHEAVIFGQTLGLQLKELNNYQRTIAEKLISDTIFYARLNKLNINSVIELNTE